MLVISNLEAVNQNSRTSAQCCLLTFQLTTWGSIVTCDVSFNTLFDTFAFVMNIQSFNFTQIFNCY